MTASFTNNGDGTYTITFAYTAASQKVLDLGEDAAHQVYDETIPGSADPITGGGQTPPEFDNLSNQEKLDLLDGAIRRHLVNLAKRYWIVSEMDNAAASASAEADTRYI